MSLEGVVLPTAARAAKAPCHLHVILAVRADEVRPLVVAVVAASVIHAAITALPYKWSVAIAPAPNHFPADPVVHMNRHQPVPQKPHKAPELLIGNSCVHFFFDRRVLS